MRVLSGFLFLFFCFCGFAGAVEPYFPKKHEWLKKAPSDAGFNSERLNEAIALSKASESKSPRDLRRAHDLTFAREAYGEPLGPFQPRGDQTGIVIRHGFIVAEWGDTVRPDMTFSVAKSFLSATVGVAFDHGLIRDLNDPVKNYVPDPALFSSDRNSRVTWDHLLRQTSDWEGTLWGKPDWADRPPGGRPLQENVERQRNEPGTSWKYNDVRVNLLALAALHVWRKPLPLVLKENVLDPIGASNTWRWYGYENSWLNLDGVMVQSVSGGSHWGGGMFISARDLARFGLLTLNNGKWAGKEIISPKWIAMAKTPTGPNPGYGFMNWYLNTGRKFLPGMPESTFCHVGNGTNAICVDPELDIVTVVRWIDSAALNAVLVKIRTAMN